MNRVKTQKAVNEPILPDDYPIYGDYLYVVDGQLYRSDWNGITVAELKRYESFSEVRRCDLMACGLLSRR